MNPTSKHGSGEVIAIVYSELIEEGATPVAWYPPGEAISYIDLTNISLKSISLLVGDKPDRARLNDPRFIVDQTNAFAIIPFPDQDTVAISIMFNYTNSDGKNVICTITATVDARLRNFLFEKHEGIEQMLKFTAFEILKVVMRERAFKKSDLVSLLQVLHEKLNRLATG
ncbi:MAG: hypothetical protein JW839_09860 [Candidatus Lokiarchaeota archaeon]|nr:hypothetical protein [Candidatus Lokiarchaeota archaeon]